VVLNILLEVVLLELEVVPLLMQVDLVELVVEQIQVRGNLTDLQELLIQEEVLVVLLQLVDHQVRIKELVVMVVKELLLYDTNTSN